MRIGLTFDLRGDSSLNGDESSDESQEEFDSPETIEAIADVLRSLGHQVTLLGDGRPMLERLLAQPPDFVFNIAEGQGVSRTREARVPAVLEMLGIPYSGSDPLTLSATLDKDCARRLVSSHGLAVPLGRVVGRNDNLRDSCHDLRYPVIIKPLWEGSSKGIRANCLVHGAADLGERVETLRRTHEQPVLIEEFIEGDEITVGMIGNEPPEILAVMRVSPKEPGKHFIYSLEVKRDFRKHVDYEVPPKLPTKELMAIETASKTAFKALGCRDVARIDFRVRHGVPYFIEVNPLPGLKPKDSDLVIMAELAGWSYSRLIETILAAATKRLAPTLHAGTQADRCAAQSAIAALER